MSRRDLIHKWLVYALAMLPVWLLDAYILPRFPVWGVSPMLLPSAVAVVAVLEGSFAGTGFGLGVGLLWELAYPGGFGGLVIGMAAIGRISGSLAQFVLSQSLAGGLFCSALSLLLLDGLRMLRALFTDFAPMSALLQVAVPEILLSLLWALPIWFLFQAVYRRVGGEKLA